MERDRKDLLDELDERNGTALQMGGEKRIEAQHAKGKLSARERIAALLDDGSFDEFGRFVTHSCTNFGMEKNRPPGDGVVSGHGTVDGRPVFVYAQDFTTFGGSLGNAHAEKICKVMDKAMENGCPLIGISDSGGARIQEGVASLAGYGEIFFRNTMASGVIPQISLILGPSAGGAVYSPGITDFILMTKKTSYMYITGPQVIKATTFEDVTHEELGGAGTHNRKSGVAHFECENDEDALDRTRKLLSFLPSNNRQKPPEAECGDPEDRRDESLVELVPTNPKKAYDMYKVIEAIVDDGVFLEVHRYWARNMIIGFARLGGMPIGIVANQPPQLAGTLDVNASVKGARFVRFLDAFNIPILTLQDVPGFFPGKDQELKGIIRNGAKLIYSYCEATVPRITVITRKAYGGAYLVMNSKHMRGDVNLAYPTAEIAVMGAAGAANIVFRKEIQAAEDQEAKRQELIDDYEKRFNNPYVAAELGYIDEVLKPEDTRPRLIRAFRMLKNKERTIPWRKHGCIPL